MFRELNILCRHLWSLPPHVFTFVVLATVLCFHFAPSRTQPAPISRLRPCEQDGTARMNGTERDFCAIHWKKYKQHRAHTPTQPAAGHSQSQPTEVEVLCVVQQPFFVRRVVAWLKIAKIRRKSAFQKVNFGEKLHDAFAGFVLWCFAKKLRVWNRWKLRFKSGDTFFSFCFLPTSIFNSTTMEVATSIGFTFDVPIKTRIMFGWNFQNN